jgi:hypothetical protein
MNREKKEAYVQPMLVTHELLLDITARASGLRHANNGFGNGGNDGVPGRSGFTDSNR